MLPLLTGIISSLVSNGLPKIAEAVTSKGLDYVEEKLGVKLEPDMSPEKLAAVKEAAMKHEEFMFEQEVKDRNSAREMQQAALAQGDSESKNFVYRFAWFWSVVSALYFFCVTFLTMPEGSRDFANIILGFLLGTAIASIFNFFYGSSKSSSDKTQAMIKGIK
jgi:hypothetical protein